MAYGEYIWKINKNFHYNTRDDNGNMFNIKGDLTIRRASKSTKTVSISGSLTLKNLQGYGTPPAFGETGKDYTNAGITMQLRTIKADGRTVVQNSARPNFPKYDDANWHPSFKNICSTYPYYYGLGWFNKSSSTTGEFSDKITFNERSFTWTEGTLRLYSMCVWLKNSWTCDMGHGNEEVGSLNMQEDIKYDPYSPPSTYVVSPPAMMRIDQTYKPSVHIVCGSGGSIHWIKYKTYANDKSWTYGRWSNIPSSIQNGALGTTEVYRDNNHPHSEINTTYNYKPNSNGCTDGTQYKLAIHFSDWNYEYMSGDDKKFKTYRKPTMSITVPANRVSPQDNAKWSWSTNQRKWTGTNEEDPFVTTGKYTCSSIDKSITGISQDTSGSYTLNATHLNSYFTAAQRSVARLTANVTLVRENTKAKVGTSAYTASDTKSFTIQYQPNKTPTGGSVTDDNNQSVKNKLIYIQETPKINVDWAYGFGGEDGGVANGYIVRVYKKSDYTDKFGNDIIVNVDTPGSVGAVEIDTKTQLKRGIMNYATITPFYTKPDGTGRIEGTSPLKTVLCKPVSKLNAPIIDYPINNTTWHNKNFRILLQLPIDDDLSELQADGKVTQDNPYKYKNIEVVIEANSSSNTYTKTNTTIYSKTLADMNYNEKIAICPGLLASHPEASSYTIKIRLQSNYYDLSDTDAWGYVATRVVKNTAVNRQTFVAGETQILIEHYKYVRDASVRLHSVYPIKALDSNNVSKDQYDEIKHINYQGISNTIRGIQEKVNAYCTYDNTLVQFTQTIDDIVSKQEYITAQDRPSDIAGRNYMNILVDDMNKLT